MKVTVSCALCVLCLPLSAQVFSPISTRNHRASSLAFLRFEPRGNLTPVGHRKFEVSFVTANDFRYMTSSTGTVEEDYEVERLGLTYRAGLPGHLEWSIELPLVSRGGGFQDPIIDWWHANVLHWSDERRNSTRFGRSTVSLPGSERFGSAAGLGDISGFLSKSCGRWIGSVGLKLPTGDSSKLLGSGNVDLGLSIEGSFPVCRKLTLFGQIAGILQGNAKRLSGTRDFVHQEALSLVLQPNGRDAWIAQWQGEASALETGVSGSDATHRLLTFGYQRRLSERQRLDLYFSEDRDVFNGKIPEGANVGPDFTMGVRISYRF